MSMALDEPHDDDEVLEDKGLTFMINKELFGQVQPVRVDFIDSQMGSGFSISSNLSTGGGCGTSCSC